MRIKRIFFPFAEVTQDELLLLFKEKYSEEQGFVRSSIYWMVNSSDVDDLVQETFFKAWKNFKRFEAKSSFRTWIYRIAMNVTYDFLKKHKEKMNEFSEEYSESVTVDLEMSDLISKGLMQLPLDQREAFSLHYQVGLTYNEAAKLLNIPEGTVKSRASSAKIRFLKFLNENGVNDG